MTLRIVQAGLGNFGKGWARTLGASKTCELVAVVEPDAAGRAWAVAELGLPAQAVFTALDDALAAAPSDAVLVVTPPETHLAVARTALRAGRHVLTEKPLTSTLAQAREAIAEARAADRILMVSQNYRFRPLARRLRDAIAAGEIGELLAIRIDCQRDMRSAYEPSNFRYAMRHPYVIDMAIHHMDLLRALTGLEIVRAAARGWRVPDSPFQHDATIASLLTMSNGATVVYSGSSATFSPPSAWTSWNGEWEIVGERGRIVWDGGVEDAELGEVRLTYWGEAPRVLEPDTSGPTGRDGILAVFAASIASGRPLETSAEDNIRSLAAVMALAASIDAGGVPVEVANL